jgi:serine/threonine protein kinase
MMPWCGRVAVSGTAHGATVMASSAAHEKCDSNFMGVMQYDSKAYSAVEDALADCAAEVKVTDFGLSRRLAEGCTHASGMKQGTPFYMAPEVADQQELRLQSDVYSFGVIMWELMAGMLVAVPKYAFTKYAFTRQFTPLHLPP